jgi:hypothetical protein
MKQSTRSEGKTGNEFFPQVFNITFLETRKCLYLYPLIWKHFAIEK